METFLVYNEYLKANPKEHFSLIHLNLYCDSNMLQEMDQIFTFKA